MLKFIRLNMPPYQSGLFRGVIAWHPAIVPDLAKQEDSYKGKIYYNSPEELAAFMYSCGLWSIDIRIVEDEMVNS